MKNKFIFSMVAGVIASVALSFCAFAQGWVADGNTWHYTNNSNEYVTDKWEQSNSGWYYLNDNGDLAIDCKIEYNGDFYYVDEHGKMISDTWMLLLDDDHEQRWMYFSSTGKAYKDGWKKIKDKNYFFENGYMNYGWLTDTGNMVNDSDSNWEEATYYCGTNEDGARFSGWLYVNNFDSSIDADAVWIYFGTNGKKYVDKTSTINGKKYRFDSVGKMTTEWYTATATASSSYYYDKQNGDLIKKGWKFVARTEDAEEKWYYLDAAGRAITDQVKKINGKWYAFDSEGAMLKGFVTLDSNGKPVSASDADTVTESEVIGYASNYMYFKENGDAATGSVKIELADDIHTFYFSKVGKPSTKSGYAYESGILHKPADDANYGVIIFDGKEVLINKSGKIQKKGTYKDSTNNIKYIVAADGTITSENY